MKSSASFMDMLLILLTLFLVLRTCSPSSLPQIPVKKVVNDAVKDVAIVNTPSEVANNLPDIEAEDEVIPEGLVDSYEPFRTEYFSGCTEDTDCTAGICQDGECKELFTQTTTPSPDGKKCPPSLVYTKKTLTTSDADEGCWAGNGPDGSPSSSCLTGSISKVANFYDAAQTQTVVAAIDRDPTREMKIRSAPATANYDLRASPSIKFNGYPTLSFIKGNTNVGLKTE